MITLAWYFLKVIICSGILCGYYFLALRNKVFHRWNRFYLLVSIVVSLLAPVIKINIFHNDAGKGTVVRMLQTISYGDEVVIDLSRNNGSRLNTEDLAESAYLLISAIFLFILFISLYKIIQLKRNFPKTKIKGISFINTNAKGTPFSFFRSIFWNNAIDFHSKAGQQIFNHELAHIKEKDSYDKFFLNIVLIFFWINPFFWLMRKELYMIHEFIADKEALEDSDINVFAEIILQTVYPGQNFSFTNNFFYSPIKRRIMMLTKNKNPKVSYISRLLVLPIAAIVFFAFTLKVNPSNSFNSYDGKTITVVIDAGHGGDDNGAISTDGLKEKDISLSIAKKIAELNSNGHIKIVLSRNNDQTIPTQDRVFFAKNNYADLFISIHVNSSANKQLNGFSVLIDKNSTEQDQLLGSSLINELKKSYKTEDNIETGDNGVWILDHNICPAALVECGYLSNTADAAFIDNKTDQEKIAKDVLAAINNYVSSLSRNKTVFSNFKLNSSITKDTIPQSNSVLILSPISNALYIIDGKIISKDEAKQIPSKAIAEINVLKGENAIKKYGRKGKNGVIEITTKTANETHTININGPSTTNSAIIFVDGKEIPNAEMQNIEPKNIQSITVLKSETAIKKFGEKGKNGVIEITTKNTLAFLNERISGVSHDPGSIEKNGSIPDKVFTKVEIEASFPGGPSAWQKYIVKKIQASLDSFTKADYGTCVLKFIVNTDGSVSKVEATTMKGTHLANIAVEAIKNGPKWIPASQNGKPVAAYRLQPVTLTNPDEQTFQAKT